MPTPLVLTFVGDDRPGLVNAIAEKVADCGATWLESRSVRLAGKFAGRRADQRSGRKPLPALELSLGDLAPSGLRISIERGAAAEAEKPARIVSLGILGRERPGIVRDVTQALDRPWRQHRGIHERPRKRAVHRRRDVSRHMRASASRTGLELDDLRKALERLAGEIMVDLAVGEGEPGD